MSGTFSASDPNPIGEVWKGMTVVDDRGEVVGEIEHVKMGDPTAVTPHGQQSEDGDLVSVLAEAVAGREPDLPRQHAEKLLRTGYIKIDASGLFGRDLYVSAEQIASVADDTVHLAVSRDELPVET